MLLFDPDEKTQQSEIIPEVSAHKKIIRRGKLSLRIPKAPKYIRYQGASFAVFADQCSFSMISRSAEYGNIVLIYGITSCRRG